MQLLGTQRTNTLKLGLLIRQILTENGIAWFSHSSVTIAFGHVSLDKYHDSPLNIMVYGYGIH